jgi:hypothetical protein
MGIWGASADRVYLLGRRRLSLATIVSWQGWRFFGKVGIWQGRTLVSPVAATHFAINGYGIKNWHRTATGQATLPKCIKLARVIE